MSCHLDTESDVQCSLPRPRLRVPRSNGSLLAVPDLAEAASATDANQSSLDTCNYNVQGRSLGELRRRARFEALQAAAAFTSDLLGERVSVPEAPSSLIVTGHQPALFHPGVWVKNFATGALAERTGGVGLNLIVDNDTAPSMAVRVPAGTRNEPRFDSVVFDEPRPAIPFEDCDIVSRQTFTSFAERVAEAMEPWGIAPIIKDVWPDAIERMGRTRRLTDCLAAARHRQERRWGLTNLEMPLSRMCRLDSFLWFTSHLLAHLPRFQECHNSALDEYRRQNRIHSRTHPVPELVSRDGWLEAPFWLWRKGDLQRQRVFARQIGNRIQLAADTNVVTELPLSPEMDACCAVEALRELELQGWRFRTRALTTTLFARLSLGDMFVHGIGGAKYDEMTDRIVETFFEICPPRFMTLSATLYLPLGGGHPATIDDLRRLRTDLRDLQYNAERHGVTGEDVQELVREKQTLLQEQEASRPEGLSKRERLARRPLNRARHRRLKQISSELASRAGGEREQLERQIAETESQLAANGILCSREYSWSLFPAESLRDLFGQLG
ncbi:hypothetical protein Mal4_28990 [Maioricimonas rarisocia]|uniref:Uncharacterized protein n=1 Tax=Maioricimonas rarisocia TaxID=2528026 RepID=A0A517Z7V2_9PLAN|nr:hypothetical protein [Maioricimonas rarisocia]QDU38570.1 hypothetical protein Mal4_28990 [Maioricimonas rarisocia]